MQQQQTVLILGARGRFGSAVTTAFAAAGWRVLAQRRSPGTPAAEAADTHDAIRWLDVDVQDMAALAVQAPGAQFDVHAHVLRAGPLDSHLWHQPGAGAVADPRGGLVCAPDATCSICPPPGKTTARTE